MDRRLTLALTAAVLAVLIVNDSATRTQQAEAGSLPADGRIAFTVIQNNGDLWNVFTIRPDGQGLARLTTAPGPDNAAAFSADGSLLAFYSRRESSSTPDVYLMDAEGGNQRRLTDNDLTEGSLDWSPDGKEIAFASSDDDHADVLIVNVETGNIRSLTGNPGTDYDPAWSPDGSKIAFVSTRDGNDEIYAMSPDGSSQVNLTNNQALDTSPSWSPDGSQIVFIRYSMLEATARIMLMNSDGTGVHELPPGGLRPRDVSWSPRGDLVLFTAASPDEPTTEDVFTVAPDGTQLQRVGNSLGTTSPVWSPSGSKIVFRHHLTTGDGLVYKAFNVVDADGANPRQIYKVSANSVFLAAWQPFFHRTGDVNCAGVVNAVDATLLLQRKAWFLTELDCEEDADANGDGSLNTVDAALILQYVAGFLPSLPP